MELGGRGGAAGPGPALGQGGLEALQHTVGSVLSSYGWYMLLAAVAVYFLVQKVSRSLAWSGGRPGAAEAAEEPDVVVRRQEALAAARLRMQEELNAQAEKYKEKQRQLEEERRRQKIAMWESMQEGKSYKGNLKLNQQEAEAGASASAVPKSKPNKKPLRGGGQILAPGKLLFLLLPLPKYSPTTPAHGELSTIALEVQQGVRTRCPAQVPSTRNMMYLGFLTSDLKFVRMFKERTWSKTIPGKVEFFSSEGSDTSIPIPIVPLPGVDDSYPPQKKSFMMLKYMHDHYLDKYEWFMRADDDVYIKGDKLENFLRSLNSSEPLFLGQTGLGTTEEMGKLALEPGENFCMGGPGVIMSREVLRRMVPHIGECLREMYTTHEDVEVGRCVRRFAGVQCVWSYEVSTRANGEMSFVGAEYVTVSVWKMDDTITVFFTAVEMCEADRCLP
ncbi:hypothetical protein HGM15179_003461 [Zosterops borbonicus]|uniref:N-acetylgalactosaminyl-proteoglycan 3-beta-glucuronosyltransferase n=1 Tax=Zosterops borbonicus TaxID=364589 RepID=A0A8K1GTA1_9PASS|nr:hypothetical protein HGM15179_003461 [Zosterops borbonicus]